jgi:hypothetical protein
MKIFLAWSDFKSNASIKGRIRYTELADLYLIEYTDAIGVIETTILKSETTDLNDFLDNYADYANKEVLADPVTNDARRIIAINRIPAGFTVYPTGQADSPTNGLRQGDELIFDANNKIKSFRINSHWYGIGGRVFWEGADLADSMKAFLKCPATVGVNQAGDFNKVATGLGFNVYVPSTPGAGAWDLDLTEVYTGTTILKCVPVPSAGNNGFFDYDSDTNVLSVNADQAGGYNLYDAELPIFCFAHKIHGKKQDGSESLLEIPDVVGKLLLNTWKIEFELVTAKTQDIKVGVVMVTAVKSNV